MSQRFLGKTVLVTGGNSGIGFATAKRIITEGGKVIITGRDPKTLEAAKKELGANAEAIQSDASRIADINALFAQIKKNHNHLDAVFANAGVANFASVEETSEEMFDQTFDINVKGVFFTLQKAIPFLKPGSSVVLNASVVASTGNQNMAVYSATKAAVRSFARTFSAELVSRGVRFNAVSPGPIETPIWSRDMPGADAAAMRDGRKAAVADSNPMKRYGTVDEVTAAIAFLLSGESSYILGAELNVDGGSGQL